MAGWRRIILENQNKNGHISEFVTCLHKINIIVVIIHGDAESGKFDESVMIFANVSLLVHVIYSWDIMCH